MMAIAPIHNRLMIVPCIIIRLTGWLAGVSSITVPINWKTTRYTISYSIQNACHIHPSHDTMRKSCHAVCSNHCKWYHKHIRICEMPAIKFKPPEICKIKNTVQNSMLSRTYSPARRPHHSIKYNITLHCQSFTLGQLTVLAEYPCSWTMEIMERV